MRRQSLQAKMQTMTPGPSMASGGAYVDAPRMTRAACRRLAVVA